MFISTSNYILKDMLYCALIFMYLPLCNLQSYCQNSTKIVKHHLGPISKFKWIYMVFFVIIATYVGKKYVNLSINCYYNKEQICLIFI